MNYDLTVIIPTYNNEKYIEKCIDSVLNNKIKIEIIVIDDGSTDKTGVILDKYKKRIKVIKSENNEGVSKARNKGLQKIHGEYFTFVDGDDFVEPKIYDVLIETAKKNNLDMCGCCYYKKSNKTIKSKYKYDEVILDNNEVTKRILEDKISMVVWDKIYKTETYKEVYFNEKLEINEDYDYTIKCIEKTNRALFINKYLYNYRINSESLTNNYTCEQIKENDYMKYINNSLKEFQEFNMFKNNENMKKLHLYSQCTDKKNRYKYLKENINKNELKELLKSKIGKSTKIEIIIYLISIRMHLMLFPIYKIIKNKIRNKKNELINEFEKITLCGKKDFCEQLAFVLDLKDYTIIEEPEKYNYNSKLIMCMKSSNRNNTKNIIKMKSIYKLMNKNYLKNISIYEKKDLFNKYNIIIILNHIRPMIKNKKIIDKIPVNFLKPSEMFIKAVNSKPKRIKCENIEKECNIDCNGYIWGCCPTWVRIPFGNIKNNNDPYNNMLSRIIKLSSINKTYCFCNIKKCKYNHSYSNETIERIEKTKTIPQKITISIDNACNLKCPSCRKCFFNKTTDKTKQIAKKLIETNWLDKCDEIIMAGQGEIFFSKTYKQLLTTNIKRNKIQLLTNGTLFNKKNWEEIKNLYKEIKVYISIDAATSETYKKLRCGNFNYLMKNLEMLSKLREENKIKRIEYNFVVQEENYNEMEQFIKLAKKLNVDQINFTKLNNWGTYTKKEYIDKSMIINNEYLKYDLYMTFKKPIFKENIVNIEQFKYYIKNSNKYYKK